jgi:hypothetical protein
VRSGEVDVPGANGHWRWLLVASATLFGAAVAATFAFSSRSANGVPTYPLMLGAAGTELIAVVAISAILFDYGAIISFRSGSLVAAVTGFTVLVAGIALTVLAFVIGTPIQSNDGSAFFVNEYPQTVYPIAWGVVELIFLPVAIFGKRRDDAQKVSKQFRSPVPSTVDRTSE